MFSVPAGPAEKEYIVKKSRFIARAAYAPDRDGAMGVVQQAHTDYADARHHCWAYLLGSPASAVSAATSDDGEPSGTAGKPILNVLQHKQVGNIVVVVSRYFGGIKLGAGGLVRAYSTSAQQVMDILPVVAKTKENHYRVLLDFSQEQDLRHWLSQHDGLLGRVDYDTRVNCEVILPDPADDMFRDRAAAKGWKINSKK